MLIARILRIFAPNPARELARHRIAGERQMIFAVARQICVEMNQPVPKALRAMPQAARAVALRVEPVSRLNGSAASIAIAGERP